MSSVANGGLVALPRFPKYTSMNWLVGVPVGVGVGVWRGLGSMCESASPLGSEWL